MAIGRFAMHLIQEIRAAPRVQPIATGDRPLVRFQVERAGLAPGADVHPQQAPNFETDCVTDRADRFFCVCGSSMVSCISAWRRRQVRSLTSTRLALSCRRRRNSAVSHWPFNRSAGWEGWAGRPCRRPCRGDSPGGHRRNGRRERRRGWACRSDGRTIGWNWGRCRRAMQFRAEAKNGVLRWLAEYWAWSLHNLSAHDRLRFARPSLLPSYSATIMSRTRREMTVGRWRIPRIRSLG